MIVSMRMVLVSYVIVPTMAHSVLCPTSFDVLLLGH